MCSDDPTFPLKDYTYSFYREFGAYACPKTMDNFFRKNHHYTWKKLAPVAREADPTEKIMFIDIVNDIILDPYMAVYIDEMGRTDKAANKTHGRGPYGKVYGEISFTRGRYKYSLMNAVWINGVLCYKIVCGGTTQMDFVRFLTRQLINVMQPYPDKLQMLLNSKFYGYQGIIGERAAMDSLIDSVERLRHKDYSKDVHKMGYLF
eukprot:22643_1